MDKLYVIKIGGNIIDDAQRLQAFLADFARLSGYKLLVHGGGKLATRLADQLGVKQEIIEGRRITDTETLKIVTMVYGGLVNKQIVAGLQALGCQALGLTGADGNAVLAHKRQHASMDYGWVGDVDAVNTELLKNLLSSGYTPVIAPLTHDGKGQLLNSNADSMAQETAKALSPFFDTDLIYSFEKSGVLLDVNDEQSVIPRISPSYYSELKRDNRIFAGMIPKLDNAFAALQSGVRKVIIGLAENLEGLINGTHGTTITHDE